MNPQVPADYAEIGRWLGTFAASHVKREDPRLAVEVDFREERSYVVRLVDGGTGGRLATSVLVELTYPEVVEGRTRFAWCADLAVRLRSLARASIGRGSGVAGVAPSP